MLRRAIDTAREQILRAGFMADILVVDNSNDGNARVTVETMAQNPGRELRYVSVPIPNISHARNAGVAHSKADYIVFLDDDEWCEPGWLDAIIHTANETQGDLVFGPVLPIFPDGKPSWDPAGRSLERRLALPTGSLIGIRHDPMISGLWIGTCNSLFRRATCFSDGEVFDPALGLCGGEDFDLFVRFAQSGKRFIWCAEAVVWEVIPARRITAQYRRDRSFMTGQQFSTIMIRRARWPLIAMLVVMLKASIQLCIVAFQYIFSSVFKKSHEISLELKLRMVFGKLVWWTLPMEPS
jgi:succinoglycan biosynthesis protein ExoM